MCVNVLYLLQRDCVSANTISIFLSDTTSMDSQFHIHLFINSMELKGWLNNF